MKGRLRFILGLLLLCLLGIYGFQGYWLYGSYRLAQAELARTTHAALETVVQRQQLSRANKVLRYVLDNRHGPAISIRPGRAGGTDSFIRLRAVPARVAKTRIDSLRSHRPADSAARLHTTVFFAPTSPDTQRLSLPPASLIQSIEVKSASQPGPDALARRLSGLIISNWQRPVTAADLPQLAALYRTELARQQVALPFRLDTVGVAGPAAVRVRYPGPTPGRATPTPAGYPLHTPPVALNPLRGPAVVASFQVPTAYLLGRLGSSLAGSVLLLALTTTCFWLMLSTILHQKKLSEVKTDFINNMTHELKTPLATVSAAVEALQDFGALRDPARTDRYLTIARQETRRLADLVEKVLHAAAAERTGATLDLHPELLHPAELVAGLVSRHQLQAPKPVRFEVDIDAADTVRFDPLHLAGVLHNLLDNAIKYSAGAVTISIRGRAAAGGWQLQVSDDGPGIPRSYQASIFEQFFRVPTGNLHPVKGFGLGLYYVRQVMECHGGHVSVRSDPGRGSAFTLWLPA